MLPPKKPDFQIRCLKSDPEVVRDSYYVLNKMCITKLTGVAQKHKENSKLERETQAMQRRRHIHVSICGTHPITDGAMLGAVTPKQ